MKELKTTDEIIAMIAEALSEADGEFIAEIAFKVLNYEYTYCGDSLIEVEKENG